MSGRHDRNSLSLRAWEQSAPVVTDSVSVRNLHATVNAGVDVWGRKRTQPVQISITVGLGQPFESAAASDSIDNSTVHYGKLSKAVLAEIEKQQATWKNSFRLAANILDITTSMATCDLCNVDIFFPKASLLGDGVRVSFKVHSVTEHTTVLHFENIRVSTIIGVNSNERDMKQSVIANVWIDACSLGVGDEYPEAEQIVIKTIEESSFETLESLAMKVVTNVMKYFVLPVTPGANVRVRVEKPSAVPFADAAAVEVYRMSSHGDPFAKRMLDELGWQVHRIPFPLKGRLGDHERNLQASTLLGFRMSISDA